MGLAAVLGVGVLLAAGFVGRSWAYDIDPRCKVFPSPPDREQCSCALRLGGWVTEVGGRWRWIYPRRHQERFCHGRVHGRPQ